MSAVSCSSWRVRASGGCPSGDGGGERGPFGGNGEAEREGEGEGEGEGEFRGEGAGRNSGSPYWKGRGANS